MVVLFGIREGIGACLDVSKFEMFEAWATEEGPVILVKGLWGIFCHGDLNTENLLVEVDGGKSLEERPKYTNTVQDRQSVIEVRSTVVVCAGQRG